jgi:carboxyl-terminal processing protease
MDTGKRRYFFLWVLGLPAALFFAFCVSCELLGTSSPSNKVPTAAEADFGLMAEAWNAIQAHYVERTAFNPQKITYGAISGMVDALGDTGHSTFLSPQMIQEEEEFTKGAYRGIGVEVRIKEGHVVIVTPLDGSPAQKAGLRPGEIIIGVNGQDITGLSLLQVVRRISGPEDTEVTLNILDPNTGRSREVSLVRASISVRNVTWHRIPGTEVAHLRIAGFSEGVTGELKKALLKIKDEDLKGLILDLRNDPGGLLDEAVSTASQFLAAGNVLLEKDTKGKITPVQVQEGGVFVILPVVCLVNGGTASAAEIVAGALQDHRRATLVGTKTFGTGTVLQRFPLSDGSALLLAVEEWLTPNGHVIWHKGIDPDFVVPLSEGASPLFPEEERDMAPDQVKEIRDPQLRQALDLIIRKSG